MIDILPQLGSRFTLLAVTQAFMFDKDAMIEEWEFYFYPRMIEPERVWFEIVVICISYSEKIERRYRYKTEALIDTDMFNQDINALLLLQEYLFNMTLPIINCVEGDVLRIPKEGCGPGHLSRRILRDPSVYI